MSLPLFSICSFLFLCSFCFADTFKIELDKYEHRPNVFACDILMIMLCCRVAHNIHHHHAWICFDSYKIKSYIKSYSNYGHKTTTASANNLTKISNLLKFKWISCRTTWKWSTRTGVFDIKFIIDNEQLYPLMFIMFITLLFFILFKFFVSLEELVRLFIFHWIENAYALGWTEHAQN